MEDGDRESNRKRKKRKINEKEEKNKTECMCEMENTLKKLRKEMGNAGVFLFFFIYFLIFRSVV